MYNSIYNQLELVNGHTCGGFKHLEKYESQLGRMTSHILRKVIKFTFQTTDQNGWFYQDLGHLPA